jgi:hypothetical protein
VIVDHWRRHISNAALQLGAIACLRSEWREHSSTSSGRVNPKPQKDHGDVDQHFKKHPTMMLAT